MCVLFSSVDFNSIWDYFEGIGEVQQSRDAVCFELPLDPLCDFLEGEKFFGGRVKLGSANSAGRAFLIVGMLFMGLKFGLFVLGFLWGESASAHIFGGLEIVDEKILDKLFVVNFSWFINIVVVVDYVQILPLRPILT